MTRPSTRLAGRGQQSLLADELPKRHLRAAERQELIRELTSSDDEDSDTVQTEQGSIPTDTSEFTQLAGRDDEDDEDDQ